MKIRSWWKRAAQFVDCSAVTLGERETRSNGQSANASTVDVRVQPIGHHVPMTMLGRA